MPFSRICVSVVWFDLTLTTEIFAHGFSSAVSISSNAAFTALISNSENDVTRSKKGSCLRRALVSPEVVSLSALSWTIK